MKYAVSPIKDIPKFEYREAEKELKNIREELGEDFGYICKSISTKANLSNIFNNLKN